MVRLPVAVHEQLVKLQREMTAAREAGRGYEDMEIAEQGTRGSWIPLAAVIERLINDFNDKRKRSGWRGNEK